MNPNNFQKCIASHALAMHFRLAETHIHTQTSREALRHLHSLTLTIAMRQLCMTIARAALEECIGQAASSLAARPGQARLG